MNSIISLSHNAARSLAVVDVQRASTQVLKGTTRITSGTRFSDTADDPGGYASALRLKFATRSSDVSQGRLMNALSLLQAQAGELGGVWRALERMSEIATLIMDPTRGAAETGNYLKELNQLRERVVDAQESAFNGQRLFVKYLGDTPGSFTVQTGDASQTMEVTRSDFSAGAVGGFWIYLLGLSEPYEGMGTDSAAGFASFAQAGGFEKLFETVSGMMAVNGAQQERVGYALEKVRASGVGSEGALSRIADTDVAQEVARLGRSTMRMNASSTVLTQANVIGELAVRLLGASGV